MTAVAADELTEAAQTERTPRRIFLALTARERMEYVTRLAGTLGRPPVGLQAAYSFKTNPRSEIVRMARACGFFAETISAEEIAWARREGFAPEETVYNGPEPLAGGVAPGGLAVVFADSLEAFERNARLRFAQVLGVRLRPSMIASRFGVPLEDDPDLPAAVAATSPATPLGVSFHARREDFHGAAWRDIAADVLERAVALASAAQRRVVLFDVGGGWTPAEFDATFTSDMRWLVERILDRLPSCTRVFFEPGQAVCTPVEALVTTVLEVRERRGRRDVVVDLAYSDWPQMHAYVHGFFAWRGDRWEPVRRGGDRLLGRTCLEYDLIEGLRFDAIAPGDRLLITDAGSYDHTMAFDFARGGGSDGTIE